MSWKRLPPVEPLKPSTRREDYAQLVSRAAIFPAVAEFTKNSDSSSWVGIVFWAHLSWWWTQVIFHDFLAYIIKAYFSGNIPRKYGQKYGTFTYLHFNIMKFPLNGDLMVM
jgi:hypothetical protein